MLICYFAPGVFVCTAKSIFVLKGGKLSEIVWHIEVVFEYFLNFNISETCRVRETSFDPFCKIFHAFSNKFPIREL